MQIRSDLDPLTAVHETIHAENERNKWHTGISDLALRNDEALAWGIQNLLEKTATLRRIEGYKGTDLAEAAKGAWSIAWGLGQNSGFPSLTNGTTFGYPGEDEELFTDTDFWDINGKYGIRFSAGHLRPVYENVLTSNDVTEADGSQIWLPATALPATSPFV